MGKNKQTDITIVVYGGPGIGKTALIGEFADFLIAQGCKVRCESGPIGGNSVRHGPPEPRHFTERKLNVKIVEKWGERADKQSLRTVGDCWPKGGHAHE